MELEIEKFVELGFDEKEIKILFSLQNGPLSGPEIEKITGLRQPEVSRALLKLQKKNYVRLVRNERRNLKGAPCKVWTLEKPFNNIIKEIVNNKLVELDKKLRICIDILFKVEDIIDPETLKILEQMQNNNINVIKLNSLKNTEN
jgi:predicted transcriptional regulator